MRRYLTTLASAPLCALAISSAVSAAKPFKWDVVAGDPYRCRTCTPKTAFRISNVPPAIAEKLLEQLDAERQGTKTPEEGTIEGGNLFRSVTFGQKKPGVKFNVLATFEGTFYTNVYHVGQWVVHHVHACSNWTTQLGAPSQGVLEPIPDRDRIVQFTCPDPVAEQQEKTP